MHSLYVKTHRCQEKRYYNFIRQYQAEYKPEYITVEKKLIQKPLSTILKTLCGCSAAMDKPVKILHLPYCKLF